VTFGVIGVMEVDVVAEEQATEASMSEPPVQDRLAA
jgi:hypothetical protein